MYSHLLLATDGSEGTAAATEHAGDVAATYGATVHVLSVVDTRNRFERPTAGIGVEALEGAERDRAERAIEDAVADLPADVPVERVVREGVPHAAILEYAAAADIDLVVMGTHGRTGLNHYLIGSVAEKVVRRCPVPVMTVRLEE